MSARVKVFFQTVAVKANRSSKGRKMMKEWVGHYDGKVVQFQTDTEKFYLVIADGKMKVHDGEYPSPDITFKGSSKLISDVFTDRRKMGEAMKSWQLVVLGAGHEGFALGQLITTMMLEA